MFKAWVPTITGHLSFSIIGTARTPKKIRKAYRIIGDNRYTVVVESRTTADGAIRLVQRLWGQPTSQCFVLLTISSKESSHNLNKGIVVVIDSADYWKIDYLLEPPSPKQTKNALSDDNFKAAFISATGSLILAADRHNWASAEVTLSRHGELEISTAENSQEAPGIIENQIFYFIRDTSHRHQHHEPSRAIAFKPARLPGSYRA